LQSHLARENINPLRVLERRFLQAQIAVELRQRISLRFKNLNFVSILDRFEMLEGVRHHEQKQAAQRPGKLLHFAAAPGILDFHQPGIINATSKIYFGRSRPTGHSPAR
jgi:hypothetical protein